MTVFVQWKTRIELEACMTKRVFNSALKWRSDLAALMRKGGLLHRVGATTEKASSPLLLSLEPGISKSSWFIEFSALVGAWGCKSSVYRVETHPLRLLKTVKFKLGGSWHGLEASVGLTAMWSYLFFPDIRWAAAFCTACRWCSKVGLRQGWPSRKRNCLFKS